MKSFSHANFNFKFNCLHFTTLTISLEASCASLILKNTHKKLFSYSSTADANDDAIALSQLLLRKAIDNELRRKLGLLGRM